ncbi:hypothetical protein KY290_001741 [Solanum tuberosum]|uniref:Uncharacterized protein n=1 Tax=Solanum tuberosum TaxID=4113 RepID=A0ABQ7WQ10_SOLTU|nr:hypothetical protein KY290_001741 [Solanum tuberosum]
MKLKESIIPRVTPETLELESLDRNDNQMHRCSDETTLTKQNIPGVTLEKIELEPLSKDESEVNQIHQCLDETTPYNEKYSWNETTPTKKNILEVIPKEIDDPMAEDERNGNKMHQCANETIPSTKENIPGVIPEEVELECLAKDEKDVNQIHQCLDETTPTKKVNILGMIPKKVELEPLAENEDEKLSSDNEDFNDGGPQKKRAEKKTYIYFQTPTL